MLAMSFFSSLRRHSQFPVGRWHLFRRPRFLFALTFLVRLGPVLPSVTFLLPESPDLHATPCEIIIADCFCCTPWQREAHNRLLSSSITALTTMGSPPCVDSKMVTSGWPSWATPQQTMSLICACSALWSSSACVCVCAFWLN